MFKMLKKCFLYTKKHYVYKWFFAIFSFALGEMQKALAQ